MENIYIETLKIGVANLDAGISYNEVKRQLNHPIPNEEFETAYINWFYSNFFESNVHLNVKTFNTNHIVILKSFKGYNNETAHITGEAIFMYYQYLEVKEARSSSRTATRISLIALAISTLAATASVMGILKAL